MPPTHHTFRGLALLLIVALTLPNPAFALRQSQNQEGLKQLAGLEDALQSEKKAPIRILFADQPQRGTVPGEIRRLIQSMDLEGTVELIEEVGESGNEQKLMELIKKYQPTIIIVFTGKRILVGPHVVHAAGQYGVKLIIRAGAGYDNISVENTARYGVPFLRSHGLSVSMADFTLRFVFAGLRLHAGTRSDTTEGDVSHDPQWQSVFQMSPADFHEALHQAMLRGRGEMFSDQKRLVFDPMSTREFLELVKILRGKRIGILGFGMIGEEVAKKLSEIRRLAGIPFEIVATSPSLSDPTSDRAAVARTLGVGIVDEQELYQTSDIVTVHIPSTDANKRYVTPQSFVGRTKPLVLVNTARRDIVDDGLFEVKQPFELTFFGDVDFDPNVIALRTAHQERFFITPHIGGLTAASAQGALDNLVEALRTALPVLLGKGDSGSIKTINRVQVTPISSGLEETKDRRRRAGAKTPAVTKLPWEPLGPNGMVGKSQTMVELFRRVETLRSDSANDPVLILGARGSGKSRLAEAFGPFRRINAGILSSLSGDALDARLLGIVRSLGSDNLIIDDLQRASKDVQSHLFQLLENRSVADEEGRDVPFQGRVIATASTLKGIDPAVQRRLKTVLHLPPLGSGNVWGRQGDAALLAEYFNWHFSQQYGIPWAPLDQHLGSVMEKMWDWSAEVSGIENTMRAVIQTRKELLQAKPNPREKARYARWSEYQAEWSPQLVTIADVAMANSLATSMEGQEVDNVLDTAEGLAAKVSGDLDKLRRSGKPYFLELKAVLPPAAGLEEAEVTARAMLAADGAAARLAAQGFLVEEGEHGPRILVPAGSSWALPTRAGQQSQLSAHPGIIPDGMTYNVLSGDQAETREWLDVEPVPDAIFFDTQIVGTDPKSWRPARAWQTPTVVVNPDQLRRDLKRQILPEDLARLVHATQALRHPEVPELPILVVQTATYVTVYQDRYLLIEA